MENDKPKKTSQERKQVDKPMKPRPQPHAGFHKLMRTQERDFKNLYDKYGSGH